MKPLFFIHPKFTKRFFAVLRCTNTVSLSVYDGGFGGWGRERPVKQQATTTVSAPARCTN
jgi:hypothetical protein